MILKTLIWKSNSPICTQTILHAIIIRKWVIVKKVLFSIVKSNLYLANFFFMQRRLQTVSIAHNPYCLGVTNPPLQSQSVKSSLHVPFFLPMAWQALLQKLSLILHFDGTRVFRFSEMSHLSIFSSKERCMLRLGLKQKCKFHFFEFE